MVRSRKTASLGLHDTNLGAEYTGDELEFLRAMESYKAFHKRRFPTFSEVLAVARSLGYRKVAEPGPLPVYREGV